MPIPFAVCTYVSAAYLLASTALPLSADTVMADADGNVENMHDYGLRLVGSGKIGDQLRKAADLRLSGGAKDHTRSGLHIKTNCCMIL